MKDITWNGSAISVEPSKKPKKITGTHFPTIVGVNPFSSPFEVWCRCTRTYEIPFEGNKYTNAGQIIEPKVFDFLRKSMGFGDRVITPENVYGKDHFKKTWGDFYPNTPIFGGMWDALIRKEGSDSVEYVVEIKTVQVDGRSGSLEDRWRDGEAPHYQALQASLYAYLLGIDKVMMVAVALEDKKGDYEHPEQVIPSYANGNVYIDEFRVSERYPNFDMYIEKATAWWNEHVLTGISPEFDEKKDAEILKALRTNQADTSGISDLLGKAERLKVEIEAVAVTLDDKQKELKAILEQIKKYALSQFRDGDTKVAIRGSRYEWVLSKSNTTELDKESLEADGLLEKYTKIKTNYRLTTSEIKED